MRAGRRRRKCWLTGGWTPRSGRCATVVVTTLALVLGAVEVSAPAGVTAITAPDWQQGLSVSACGFTQADHEHADYAVLVKDRHARCQCQGGGSESWLCLVSRMVWQGAAAYLRTVPDVEAVDAATQWSRCRRNLRLDPAE